MWMFECEWVKCEKQMCLVKGYEARLKKEGALDSRGVYEFIQRIKNVFISDYPHDSLIFSKSAQLHHDEIKNKSSTKGWEIKKILFQLIIEKKTLGNKNNSLKPLSKSN